MARPDVSNHILLRCSEFEELYGGDISDIVLDQGDMAHEAHRAPQLQRCEQRLDNDVCAEDKWESRGVVNGPGDFKEAELDVTCVRIMSLGTSENVRLKTERTGQNFPDDRGPRPTRPPMEREGQAVLLRITLAIASQLSLRI